MKALAYIRVSGKSQVEGDGPDRQREKIAAFCKANGLENGGKEFFEQGVSGTVDGLDRPEFVQLLEYCEMYPADDRRPAIVVERMDRLARDLMVQEMLLAECRKRGIKVFSADQGLLDQANDSGDPTRTLIRQILGAVSQWEKSVIVMKLKAARDKKRRETGRCGGTLPYGQLPGEDEVLEYMLQTMRVQGMTFAHLAGSLNLSGFKTREGKPWNKQRVYHVLKGRKQ